MGFFSWLTSDTQESIANNCTDRCRPVYLLQPGGLGNILESSYAGYGDFGSVDAFEWLARMNLSEKKVGALTDDELRSAGIGIDVGSYFRDKAGKKWLVFHDYRSLFEDGEINYFSGTYADVIPEYGKSANDLNASGEFVEHQLCNNFAYPLKFSFDKDAVYEGLPAAKNCPDQGFFY